jgi:aerobic-type carbon monoxide dehydrogenase small subunit (CoxS/CutS family)
MDNERGGAPATVLVNGQHRAVNTEPDTALLYVLRNHLG